MSSSSSSSASSSARRWSRPRRRPRRRPRLGHRLPRRPRRRLRPGLRRRLRRRRPRRSPRRPRGAPRVCRWDGPAWRSPWRSIGLERDGAAVEAGPDAFLEIGGEFLLVGLGAGLRRVPAVAGVGLSLLSRAWTASLCGWGSPAWPYRSPSRGQRRIPQRLGPQTRAARRRRVPSSRAFPSRFRCFAPRRAKPLTAGGPRVSPAPLPARFFRDSSGRRRSRPSGRRSGGRWFGGSPSGHRPASAAGHVERRREGASPARAGGGARRSGRTSSPCRR